MKEQRWRAKARKRQSQMFVYRLSPFLQTESLFTGRLRVVPHFSSGIYSSVSETRARVKITPCEKRRHTARREENERLQTKPKLLNLCVALTAQNSDWLFHGNLSTSVKNTPAAINTQHNHNLQNKQLEQNK